MCGALSGVRCPVLSVLSVLCSAVPCCAVSASDCVCCLLLVALHLSVPCCFLSPVIQRMLLSPRVLLSLCLLAVWSVHLPSVSAYQACPTGDTACGNPATNTITVNGQSYCCPPGASPSTNGVSATCSGGIPAGCTTAGTGLSIWSSDSSMCSATACSPTGSNTCRSYSVASGTTQGLNLYSLFGYSTACGSGQQSVFTQLKVVTTNSDNYRLRFADNSGLSVSSVADQSCYRFVPDYQQAGSQVILYITCNNAFQTCTGTVSSTILCGSIPSDTACTMDGTGGACSAATSATSVTGNNNNKYCCATTSPTFGTYGYCSCAGTKRA